MIEHAKGHDPGQENTDRPHLFDNKGDGEQRKLTDQGHGFALFHEIVDLFKKINQQIDGNEAQKEHRDIFEKLKQNITFEKIHSVAEVRENMDTQVAGVARSYSREQAARRGDVLFCPVAVYMILILFACPVFLWFIAQQPAD